MCMLDWCNHCDPVSIGPYCVCGLHADYSSEVLKGHPLCAPCQDFYKELLKKGEIDEVGHCVEK